MKLSDYQVYVALYISYLVIAPVALILTSIKFFGDSPADLGGIVFVAFGAIIFVVFAILEYRWLKGNKQRLSG